MGFKRTEADPLLVSFCLAGASLLDKIHGRWAIVRSLDWYHRKIPLNVLRSTAGVSELHLPLSSTYRTNAATLFKVCAPPRAGVAIAVGYDSFQER